MTVQVLERRVAKGTVEFRAADEGTGPGRLTGHAAVFNRWSVDLGGFREQVDPKAFDRTVRQADVVALWNHDDGHLLGRVASGTLALTVDERGLHYDVDLPDTTLGRDLAELGRRGDVRGSSFGFRTVRDEWHEDEDGNVTRTLLEVALIDVSPVTRPAYPDTDAAVRSLARVLDHDPAEVRQLIEAHDLGRLIRRSEPADPAADPGAEPADPEPTPVEDEHTEEGADDARVEPTVIRPRLLHLYV